MFALTHPDGSKIDFGALVPPSVFVRLQYFLVLCTSSGSCAWYEPVFMQVQDNRHCNKGAPNLKVRAIFEVFCEKGVFWRLNESLYSIVLSNFLEKL